MSITIDQQWLDSHKIIDLLRDMAVLNPLQIRKRAEAVIQKYLKRDDEIVLIRYTQKQAITGQPLTQEESDKIIEYASIAVAVGAVADQAHVDAVILSSVLEYEAALSVINRHARSPLMESSPDYPRYQAALLAAQAVVAGATQDVIDLHGQRVLLQPSE